MKGDLTDYNLDLETKLGETKVGERSEGRSYISSNPSNKEIRVETNIGEIKVF